MDEERPPQVAKLREREVGGACRVSTLLAVDAEANVSLLDHGYVVGTVADRCRHRFLFALFDQAHDLVFRLRFVCKGCKLRKQEREQKQNTP